MKTKEFADKLKDYGFYVKHHLFQYTGVVDISTRGSVNDPTLADISETEMGVVSFNGPIIKDVGDIIMEYANTPIEKRREEKKSLVHLKGINKHNSYLNYHKDLNDYFIGNRNDDAYYKARFTKSEIDKLVEDPDFFLQKGSYTLED
ncbi:hypothetical protein LpeD_80 [Lactobacillus phage LpeD]|uniref:Uncharacterized protein n=1 Tax=Lactobacillus phage LpeD TaxID=2041210 RepID=A0A291I9K6_9CAUD|nr:hypothetical protein HWB32_gp058 [Lactobacillus phage LpeD]ATG86365.1 hypothetical protein LpeD_80 [Lactobacillus phage LpeD]